MSLAIVAGALLASACSNSASASSCHNPLKLGANSISPVFVARLKVGEGEFEEIEKMVREFAQQRGWDIVVIPNSALPGHAWFQASVCETKGTLLSIDYIGSFGPDENGIFINVYQPQGGSSWKEPAKDLLQTFEAEWPGRLEFLRDSQLVARPAWYPDPIENP